MSRQLTAVFFVKMNYNFGVGRGFETVPASFEAVAQLPVIVNFTIEDDLDAAIFIAQRLRAA